MATETLRKQKLPDSDSRSGREYRKQLSEKFRIVFGPEVGYTFQKSKTDTNLQSESTANIWSIDAILGVNYTFSDNFLILESNYHPV